VPASVPLRSSGLIILVNKRLNSITNFCDALIAAYLENPCQVLPNALWKTLAQVERLETRYEMQGNRVTHLEAWGAKELFIYWDRERNKASIPAERLAELDLALVHQDFLDPRATAHLTSRTPYFRLMHTGPVQKRPQLPPTFALVQVDARREAEAIARLIGECHGDPHFPAEWVRDWTQQAVFDPTLWVWVVDTRQNKPVGLGIAELDRTVGEGSLEWMQVLPAYRRQGLGQALVLELLSRLAGRAAFVTVGGQVENPTHPEALYRRCGFRGQDVWWVLRP